MAMNCQIAPLKNRRTNVDTLPPRGKVSEVRKEWLVHEDGALAYRLQDEEFKQHLSGNKERNVQIREDFPCAKSEQTREQENAARVYQEWLQQQEAEDERVAREVAEKIQREDEERQIMQEERDIALARQLQEKERERIERKERERHQDRRDLEVHTPRKERPAPFLGDADTGDLSELGAVGGTSPDMNDVGLPVPSLAQSLRSCRLTPSPSPMSEDDARKLQEERDAELARRLQEEEEPTDPLMRDRLLAIETQDKELARLLWEKERARLRRAKERARAKAAARRTVETGGEEPRDSKPRYPDPDEIVNLDDPTEAGAVGNIAMVIDPTYPRGSHMDSAYQRESSLSRHSPIHHHAPVTPPGTLTLTHSSPEPDSPTTAPPYMPIQGQRRFPDKKQKGKDGCKHQ